MSLVVGQYKLGWPDSPRHNSIVANNNNSSLTP